jgi:3-methyladenine DNA glycosylase AlkD
MNNAYHKEILSLIKANSGKGNTQTFSDSYLGNKNPRYAITAPVLRAMAKAWMKQHKHLSVEQFAEMLTSLIEGKSSTEKSFAGILMDYATKEQGAFDPKLFNEWLNNLEGWAEIDSVCTGEYTIKQVVSSWEKWAPLLTKLSDQKSIAKRRASLVFFCSPVSRHEDQALAVAAFKNIDRLKSEKNILITKAISWLLRSMIKHHKKLVEAYVKENRKSLPKIAVRETLVKLKTGKKTGTQ